MCGEHTSTQTKLGKVKGSSPHVRGTLPFMPRPFLRSGIIPACAGNTILRENPARWRGDHPRMCGEHTCD